MRCTDGWIELLRVQPEGRRPMEIQEFLNGLHNVSFRIRTRLGKDGTDREQEMSKTEKLIAPSILSADFAALGEEVQCGRKSRRGLDSHRRDGRPFRAEHDDRPVVVEAVKRHTKLPLDVHLMIENPDEYLEEFVKAGANIVTVHQEAGKPPASHAIANSRPWRQGRSIDQSRRLPPSCSSTFCRTSIWYWS